MSLFIDALQGRPTSRFPVWLMRQAGRYMPSYQNIRKKASLYELFHDADLAAEITLLPIEELHVDASIIFSDILVILKSIGIQVHYPEIGGPFTDPQIIGSDQIDFLLPLPVEEVLSFVFDAIRQVVRVSRVPLIGFAGGPFTVASYALEARGKHHELMATRKMMYREPKSFKKLLDLLTRQTIEYLKLQIAAGARAVQLFDSWAGVLSQAEYQIYSLDYAKQIMDAIAPTPLIYFSRGTCLYRHEIAQISPTAISFDWHASLADLRMQIPDHIAVQGNFDPMLLFMETAAIADKVQTELKNVPKKGTIINLGHGVLPHTPYEHVRHFIDSVHSTT